MPGAAKNMKILSVWLACCCALVFAMVMIGAITRLSEAGLSITEWKPLLGAIPPLNQAQWDHVFALYKQSPEFRDAHYWMELADFKKIYFWEWFHRLLGRLIGIVYAAPLVFFWIRGLIPQGYKLKLLGLFILGGMQGVLGWWMVKSGLIDVPSVSHYRLAAHLALALLIYSLMLYASLVFRGAVRAPSKPLYIHAWIALAFVIVTMTWGAFTAGLDAGLIYNEFPLMGGGFVPPDMWHRAPAWINLLENQAAVQFAHRWLAVSTALVLLSLVGHALARKEDSGVFWALGAMAFAQVGLGIATLLSGVYLHIAVAHQAGAVVILSLLVALLYRLKPGARIG